jgi:hypothetical protein
MSSGSPETEYMVTKHKANTATIGGKRSLDPESVGFLRLWKTSGGPPLAFRRTRSQTDSTEAAWEHESTGRQRKQLRV